MRRLEVELLEDDLDEGTLPTSAELGLSIDLAREDLEDEDDDDGLGLRALYARPEMVLRRPRWDHAA